MADILLENLMKIRWFQSLDESDQEAIREALAEIEALPPNNVSKQALNTLIREIRDREVTP